MRTDYGFELPDIRDEYIDMDGEAVSICIKRDYYTLGDEENEETHFRVAWSIIRTGRSVVTLPVGSTEQQARKIARELYEEDIEASTELRDMRAEEAAERRMGA